MNIGRAELGTSPEAAFKEAMSTLAAGVCIVSTIDRAGRAWGFTATSVTSVSLHPPLVLVCLGRASRCHPVFASASHFAIDILAEHQRELAVRFAAPLADRFAGSGFEISDAGVPTHPDSLSHVECRRVRTMHHGDHSIIVAGVLRASAGQGRPLVYHGRGFRSLDG